MDKIEKLTDMISAASVALRAAVDIVKQSVLV